MNKIKRAFRLMIVRIFCYNTVLLGGPIIVIPIAYLLNALDASIAVCRFTADFIGVLLLVFRYKIFNYFIKFER